MSALAGEGSSAEPDPNQDPKPKSIITLYVLCHGTDIPSVPVSDPSVRILSQAGRFGCWGWGFSDEISPERVEEFITRLKDRNPQISTYSILEKIKMFLQAHSEKNIGIFDPEKYITAKDKTQLKKGNKTINFRRSRHTQNVIKEYEDWQIYTPIMDHLYNFSDSKLEAIQGIFVIDIKNKPEQSILKVGDDLLEIMNEREREGYEEAYKSEVSIGKLTQSSLINDLKGEGFDIINIVDKSCRAYGAIMPKEEFAKINAKEDEASESIDITLGGKKRRKSTRKRRKRRNFKRKTRISK